MTATKTLLAGAMLFVSAGTICSTPADAQQTPGERERRAQQNARSRVELGGRTLTLSTGERNALAALDAASRGTDRAAQDAALAAAVAAATSDDARYAIALLQINVAQQRQDQALLAATLDTLIASPMTPPESLANYVGVRAGIAYAARDMAAARAGFTRLLELRPNDPGALYNLAQVSIASNDNAGALPLLQRAIAARTASGEAVPEAWYRQAMIAAYGARQLGATAAAGQALVTTYPTATNWRDALVAYRQAATLDDDARVDLLRLMRAAGALSSSSEYFNLAQTLTRGGLGAEARAVLDEGVSRSLVSASSPDFQRTSTAINQAVTQERTQLATAQRTAATAPNGTVALRAAESLAGSGRHAEAIPFYRTALQKGGVDANVVNARLGMAFALAGQRAEAEAAFRAVTGPRADLAGFQRAWLAQRR